MDTYLERTFGVFLNLFIPLFWEGRFCDFASDKRELLKAFDHQLDIGMSLLDSLVDDTKKFQGPGQSVRSKLLSDNIVLYLQSRVTKSARNTTTDSAYCDTKLRRYTTERVVVKCVTHDPDVIDRFSEMDLLPPKLPLTFIISHPHGYFKHIGFGKLTGVESGHDQSYYQFVVKKLTKYRISGDAAAAADPLSPVPLDATSVPFHTCDDVIKPGEEYHLERNVHLAVTSQVFVDAFSDSDSHASNSTGDEGVTWFTFPRGTAYVINDKHRLVPFPERLEFCRTDGYDHIGLPNPVSPSCVLHNVPTCPGSSGSLLNTSAVASQLFSHCGARYEGGIFGFTSLSISTPNKEEVKLKDVLRSTKPVLFVGGRHLPNYPGPKS